MKIYTKTGDKGLTSLFDGTRVKKYHMRVDTYGTVDELNSVIGVVLSKMQNIKVKNKNQLIKLKSVLTEIQHDLLEIGSLLANPSVGKEFLVKKKEYFENIVSGFENYIDELTKQMPELTNFILPGGSEAGAFLHVARTLTRRVERKIVSLAETESIEKSIVIYFNRLSDLLFTMSRYVNFQSGKKEIIWSKKP